MPSGDNSEGSGAQGDHPLPLSGLPEPENKERIRSSDIEPTKNTPPSRVTVSDGLMIFFTAAIAATGVIGAIIFGNQLGVMQGQLDAMKDDQRPWLKATPKIVGGLTSKGGLLSMNIEIDISNVGRTPASAVRGAALIFGSGKRIVTQGDLKAVCDRAALLPPFDQDSASYLIFPNGNGSIFVQAVDNAAYVEEGRIPEPAKQVILGAELALVYCVSYLNAGREPFRRTGESLVIAGFKIDSVLRDGELIDNSELRLARNPFDLKWRSYAD